MPDVVVVSSSSDGKVVANALAARGHAVTLLALPGPIDPDPSIPAHRGLYAIAPDDVLGTEVFGPLLPVSPTRGLLIDGVVRDLPLNPRFIFRIFPPTTHPLLARSLASARAGRALADLIGGGREQRTYRDWVVQHFGEPVFERLYGPYARKRFGPPEDLLSGVARIHHGPVPPWALVAPSDGPRAALARLDRVVEVPVGVVRAVHGEGVETDVGSFAGTVWVDLPPAQLLPLLPGAGAAEVRHHVERMVLRHGVEVLLRGAPELPFETHAVDAETAFFRVVRPALLPGAPAEMASDTLVVQFVIDPTDTRWQGADTLFVDAAVDGLQRAQLPVDRSTARVRRLPHTHPVWSTGHLVRLRHWLLFLEECGVTPFGRAGLAAPVDPGTLVRWVDGRTGVDPVDVRELARQLLEPPVRDPDERPHLRSFVVD